MIRNEIIIKSLNFKAPEKLVIILHGYGNKGSDYARQVEEYYACTINNAIFALPDAPEPCETWTGRQWFSLTLDGMDCSEIRRGLDKAAPILEQYIRDKSVIHHCDNVYLVGISQGAFMSLEMIYRTRVAGIISYCGLFAKRERRTPVSKPDVLLVHSENDKIVPYSYAEQALADLSEMGMNVELKTYQNIGHNVTPDCWKYGAERMGKGARIAGNCEKR